MPKISEVTKRTQARSTIQALSKRFSQDATVRVDGKTYVIRDLTAAFQGHLDVLDQLVTLRAQLAAKVAEERALAAKAQTLRARLLGFVRAEYGISPSAFADFAYPMPKKRGPKTAAAKALGAERLRATRKARGTMGKRQRSKIKGTV
jgi:hypothetical protein